MRTWQELRTIFYCPACEGEVVACRHYEGRTAVRQEVRTFGGPDCDLLSARPATQEDLDAFAAAARPDYQPPRGDVPSAAEVTAEVLRVVGELKDRPPLRSVLTPEQQRARQAEERRWRAGRAGVPERYLRLLTGLADWPALLAVRAWAASDRQCLLLQGANQAGKSVAAAAWISSKERGAWAGAGEIGLAVQPDDTGQSTAWLRELRKAGALVVDNVGERCGPGGYEEIESLIMHHLAKEHRVVVTTDLDAGDFFGLFGDERRNRIKSRWDLRGKVVCVEPVSRAGQEAAR